MTDTALVGTDADFTRTLTIDATPAALRAAITTDEGVSGWWSPTVSRGPELLSVSFGNIGVDLRVVARPELVVWDVVSCSAEPDWVGTTIEFASAADAAGTIELVFTHRGLAALPCAETCFAGWTHYLPSLVSYVESGVGNPGPRRS
ncbi:MAG: SRPBCC domain-containing protein [Candidatus Dormibacteraeota bacterium]|uniref:SRPBCC domain-containing protein n=1 Tax=Candidatus Amunia macphersoniae TaxID=3127014 RepID=A0A934KNN4_9BACT|nr:SRPBCC domain-containing protein [Candidatus Dormibacteraeota bacterium]